jgi:hypothetical protein
MDKTMIIGEEQARQQMRILPHTMSKTGAQDQSHIMTTVWRANVDKKFGSNGIGRKL